MRWSIEHGMTVRRLGTGPDLVWLHGLGEQSASFDPIAQHPALAGFTHVLPDLPGYGRSAWPADPAGDPGGALEALADHLAGWLADHGPVAGGGLRALIGHSMGGVLATLIAERMTVGAVIDVDGNLTRGDCTFSAVAAGQPRAAFVATGFAAMRAALYERGLSDPALRGYHAALTLASPHVFHAHATDLVALSATETLAARLAAVRAPVRFLAGVPGGICARSRALLDEHGVAWSGIGPSGHWPFIDQPEAFARAVAGVVCTA